MNDQSRYPIVELRQYTLRPGQRDVLIDLFDSEFVSAQEADGMAVIGQFRDLDDPDRFVWLRGFPDMATRADALGRFYGGPVWKAHREQANATMIDSDNVLLLRPAAAGTGFPGPAGDPPAAGADSPEPVIGATLCFRDHPFDQDFLDFFDDQVRPAVAEAGAAPLAWLSTEYAPNNFPALPVREGEHAFAWFARFASRSALAEHERRLAGSALWQERVLRPLAARITMPPHQLRLVPTAGSRLR